MFTSKTLRLDVPVYSVYHMNIFLLSSDHVRQNMNGVWPGEGGCNTHVDLQRK